MNVEERAFLEVPEQLIFIGFVSIAEMRSNRGKI
jgi:hypothetical protein